MNISVPFRQLFRIATALSLVLLHSTAGMAAAVPKQVEKIDPADLAIGRPAPEIVGETVDGEEIRLSDFRGKVVVLDFWGDW